MTVKHVHLLTKHYIVSEPMLILAISVVALNK